MFGLFTTLRGALYSALQQAPFEEEPQTRPGVDVPDVVQQSPSEAVRQMIQECHDFFLGRLIDGQPPVWTGAQKKFRELLYQRIHKADLLKWFQDVIQLCQGEQIRAYLKDLKPFSRAYLLDSSKVEKGRSLRFSATLSYEPPPVRALGVFCPEDFKLIFEPMASFTVSIEEHVQLQWDKTCFKYPASSAAFHFVYEKTEAIKYGTSKFVNQGFEFSKPMTPSPNFMNVLAVSRTRIYPKKSKDFQISLFENMQQEYKMNQYVLNNGGEGIVVPMTKPHFRPNINSRTGTNLYAYSPYMGSGDYQEYLNKQKVKQSGIGKRIQLFARVLEKVAALHRLGVIHRDLKPNNVMLTDDGKDVLLIDLGNAHFQSEKCLAFANQCYISPEALYLCTNFDQLPEGTDSTLVTDYNNYASECEANLIAIPHNYAWKLVKLHKAYFKAKEVSDLSSSIKSDAWAVGIMWLETLLPAVPLIHENLYRCRKIEDFCSRFGIRGWQKKITCGLLHYNLEERMSVENALGCIPFEYRQTAEQTGLSAGAAAGAGGGSAAAGAGELTYRRPGR